MSSVSMEALAAVTKKTLPDQAFRVCHVMLTQSTITGGIKEFFDDYQPIEGWLWCSESGDHHFTQPLEELPGGEILNGELVLDDKTSLQVQFCGQGQWQLIHKTEHDTGEGLGDMVQVLAETFCVKAAKSSLGDFMYQRYWHTDDEGKTTQFADRFTGFGQPGDDHE